MLGAMLAATVSLVIRSPSRASTAAPCHGGRRLSRDSSPPDLLGAMTSARGLLLGLLVVAGAVAVSMLRYRLYDIDSWSGAP